MARGDGCTRYREEKEIVRVFDCQFDPGFAGFVDREAGPVLASTWKSKNGRRKGGIAGKIPVYSRGSLQSVSVGSLRN